MIEIVIPVHKDCEQLDKTLQLLRTYRNKTQYRLTLIKDGTNVSEARQIAMNDKTLGDRICFLDYDSEVCHDGWLDGLVEALEEHTDAGAVFGGEWWGLESAPEIIPIEGDKIVEPGNGTPAACMILDRSRLDLDYHIWDKHIGLRNGWLGGDFEEVDFCYRLEKTGLKLYSATKTLFHHTGGKGTYGDFSQTDRHISTMVMRMLLAFKYNVDPENEDYFKEMKYVKADANNDDMLAAESSFRDAYHDVLIANGFRNHGMCTLLGLV